MARSLPDIAGLMEPAPDGLRRDRDATPGFQLSGERGTTPACPTPAEGRRRNLEQGQQGAPQAGARQRWRRLAGLSRRPQVEVTAPISSDCPIDTGARAEERRGD